MHGYSASNKRIKRATAHRISQVFDQLDYSQLGTIYCEVGGEEFWQDRRLPCQQLGVKLANTLLKRLPPSGRSLYVGAGVAEIPMLVMESLDLGRDVEVFNLREGEVALLNDACKTLPFQFQCADARMAQGSFDHVWIVSVLNDPEHFPELSALSYDRADPLTFDPTAFAQERSDVLELADACLSKLALPGLVTTSVEELVWITYWCTQRGVPYGLDRKTYPRAIVEDPACFIKFDAPQDAGLRAEPL